jgi:hypothetical protein
MPIGFKKYLKSKTEGGIGNLISQMGKEAVKPLSTSKALVPVKDSPPVKSSSEPAKAEFKGTSGGGSSKFMHTPLPKSSTGGSSSKAEWKGASGGGPFHTGGTGGQGHTINIHNTHNVRGRGRGTGGTGGKGAPPSGPSYMLGAGGASVQFDKKGVKKIKMYTRKKNKLNIKKAGFAKTKSSAPIKVMKEAVKTFNFHHGIIPKKKTSSKEKEKSTDKGFKFPKIRVKSHSIHIKASGFMHPKK